jgi:hypothetical protein
MERIEDAVDRRLQIGKVDLNGFKTDTGYAAASSWFRAVATGDDILFLAPVFRLVADGRLGTLGGHLTIFHR